MDQGVDQTLIQSIKTTFCFKFTQIQLSACERCQLICHLIINTLVTKNFKSIISKGQLRTQLECSICYEIFKEPRELPCGHSFCTACLERLASFGNLEYVDCPSCRKRHKRPSNGFRIDFKAFELFRIFFSEKIREIRKRYI